MLGLTQQERKVILFLITVAIVGIGINFLYKKYPRARQTSCLNITFDKINLNQADKKSLMSISGIGEKSSQRIIEFREKNGGFKAIEELKAIKGFSDYRYEKVKDYLTIE